MNQIFGIDTSTCTFTPNDASAKMGFVIPAEERIVAQFCMNNNYTYWTEDPSFGALVSFDRAKILYTLRIIQLLKLKNSNVVLPSFLVANLERFEMATDHLIRSRYDYRMSLAEENRMHDEFLEEDFFVEMSPAEEFEIKAKVVFEDGQPDLSGLEEF